MSKLKVFVSSRISETHELRKIAKGVIEKLDMEAIMWENFGDVARPISTQDAYLKEIQDSNVFLGIYGYEYGEPNSDGMSAIELEFKYASSINKPQLIFIFDSPSENREQRLKIFLDDIENSEKGLIRYKFRGIDDLWERVEKSLIRWMQDEITGN